MELRRTGVRDAPSKISSCNVEWEPAPKLASSGCPPHCSRRPLHESASRLLCVSLVAPRDCSCEQSWVVYDRSLLGTLGATGFLRSTYIPPYLDARISHPQKSRILTAGVKGGAGFSKGGGGGGETGDGRGARQANAGFPRLATRALDVCRETPFACHLLYHPSAHEVALKKAIQPMSGTCSFNLI